MIKNMFYPKYIMDDLKEISYTNRYTGDTTTCKFTEDDWLKNHISYLKDDLDDVEEACNKLNDSIMACFTELDRIDELQKDSDKKISKEYYKKLLGTVMACIEGSACNELRERIKKL